MNIIKRIICYLSVLLCVSFSVLPVLSTADTVIVPEPINYKGTITVSQSEGELALSLDGKKIELSDKPFIDENNRTLVPAREFCKNELIDRKIRWHDEPRQVSFGNSPYLPDTSPGGAGGGDSLFFIIDEYRYRINNRYYDTDTCAKIIDNKAYVPLRILCEFFRYEVAWASDTE